MTTTSTAAIVTPRTRVAAKARIIGALLLSALLSACGFVQLSYNNAPDLIYYWLDGYVGFDDAQKPRVLADVAQLQRWHRAEELPRYTQLLQQLAQAASEDLSADAVCNVQREVQKRFDVLLTRSEPAVRAIATDFSAGQYRHLEARFDKQNAKFRSEWIDAKPAERFDRRLKRAVEQAERLYGRLDEPQLAVLRENLTRSRFDPVQSLAESKRRQRATLAVLQSISNKSLTPEELRTAILGWFDQLQRSPDAAARERQAAFASQSCANIADLHNSTSSAQRAQAAQRLRGYARDFQELSGRPSGNGE